MTVKTHTIIIAEDDPYLREAYERRFARTPFQVHTVDNAEKALDAIRQQPPDVLICDIMMPGKQGWWVLEQLPKDKRSFPVIMLTNQENDDMREKCEQLGADGYFVKSKMSLSSLVDMAQNILGQSPSSAV